MVSLGVKVKVNMANGYRAYDERKPLEPSYPSITPSIADFILERNVNGKISVNGEKTFNGDGVNARDEEELRFAPPGYVHSTWK